MTDRLRPNNAGISENLQRRPSLQIMLPQIALLKVSYYIKKRGWHENQSDGTRHKHKTNGGSHFVTLKIGDPPGLLLHQEESAFCSLHQETQRQGEALGVICPRVTLHEFEPSRRPTGCRRDGRH